MSLKNINPRLVSAQTKAMGVDIESPTKSTPHTESAIKYQFLISIFGLTVGLIMFLLGSYLIYLNVGSEFNWNLKMPGLESTLGGTTAGMILIVTGVIVVYITRFSYKYRINLGSKS